MKADRAGLVVRRPSVWKTKPPSRNTERIVPRRSVLARDMQEGAGHAEDYRRGRDPEAQGDQGDRGDLGEALLDQREHAPPDDSDQDERNVGPDSSGDAHDRAACYHNAPSSGLWSRSVESVLQRPPGHDAISESARSRIMRDRILELLRQKSRPLPADQVLSEALGVAFAEHRDRGQGAEGDPPQRSCLPKQRRALVAARSAAADVAQPLSQAAILYLEQAKGSRDPLLVRGALIIPQTGFAASFGLLGNAAGFAMPGRVRRSIEGRVLVCWSNKHARLWRRILSRQRLQAWDGDTLELRGLAERLLGQGPAVREPADLAPLLGLAVPEAGDPVSMARFMAACWQALLDQTPEEHRRDASSLRQWLDAARPRVDFSQFGFGAAFLRTLPESPGVYIMKNRADDIVYVGKSRNLKRRIRSYFTPAALRDRQGEADPRAAPYLRIHRHGQRGRSATAGDADDQGLQAAHQPPGGDP